MVAAVPPRGSTAAAAAAAAAREASPVAGSILLVAPGGGADDPRSQLEAAVPSTFLRARTAMADECGDGVIAKRCGKRLF